MPWFQKIALSKKKHAIDSGVISPTTKLDANYKSIAADIVGVARTLRKARTSESKREVIAALLWHAESIRRVLLAEQKALLNGMAERPQ